MATAPTPELTQTARVLLGMIAEGHSTGYAIKAEIERSTRLYWGASVGGIYPELRRLTAAGLIDVRDDPRGGARRHCYSLTDAGRAALAGWLTDDAEPVYEFRNELLLRLRFAGVLAPEERLRIVRRIRAFHEERAAALEDQLAQDGFDDAFDRLTVEYGLGLNRWAAGWAADAETTVESSVASDGD